MNTIYLIANAGQAKQSARALEKALVPLGCHLKHGQALNVVARLAGYADWNAYADSFSARRVEEQLLDVEREHRRLAGTPDYGPESELLTHTGFRLRVPAYPATAEYVRVLDPLGQEVGYWTADEWAQDPEDVMGALAGALIRGTSAGPAPGQREPDPISPVPVSRVAELEQALLRLAEEHDQDLYTDAPECRESVRRLAALRQWARQVARGPGAAPFPEGIPTG